MRGWRSRLGGLRGAIALGLAIGLITGSPVEAAAPKSPARTAAKTPKYVPPKYASIVIDAETGAVLHSVDADEQTYPASLTKMMTLYLTFEALAQHRIQLEHRLGVSEHAAAMAPSKLSLKPGSSIRVEEAILAVVTKSANDAAVVIAEGLGGSEDNFAAMMTRRARALGMTRTNFANASGLPNDAQVTTARDMALLGRALIHDFPQYYPYFSTRSFMFAGHIQANHNHLLDTYDGADGIKTGFIRASGFNLVASAQRNGRRLIGVVFGGQSQPWRDHQMARLLDQGFARTLAGENVTANVRDPVLSDTVPAKLVRLDLGDLAPSSPVPSANAAPLPIATPVMAAPPPPPVPAAKPAPGPRLARTLTPVEPPPAARTATGTWLVQVGAFKGPDQATAASKQAIRTANLHQGQINVSALQQGHAKLYRARVGGLAETQARDACKMLARQHMTCVVLTPGGTVAR